MEFPDESELGETLGMALGKDVEVSEADDFEADSCTSSTWLFVDDDDTPLCVVATELRLAHSAGAALAMMPPGRAECDDVDAELVENYREVVNIISGAVNALNPSGHIRLVPGTCGTEAPPPDDADSVLTVEIDGYPVGNIAFADV